VAPTVEITTFIRTIHGPDAPLRWQNTKVKRVRIGDIEFPEVHNLRIRRSDEFPLEHPTAVVEIFPKGVESEELDYTQPIATIRNVRAIRTRTEEIS